MRFWRSANPSGRINREFTAERAEIRLSGEGVFAKSAPRTARNEPQAAPMLINGVAFTAHHWPHAEWPRPLPKNSYMACGTTCAAEGPAERGIGADRRVALFGHSGEKGNPAPQDAVCPPDRSPG